MTVKKDWTHVLTMQEVEMLNLFRRITDGNRRGVVEGLRDLVRDREIAQAYRAQRNKDA